MLFATSEQQANDFVTALKSVNLAPVILSIPAQNIWVVCRDANQMYKFIAARH